jgi:hypothetical protein
MKNLHATDSILVKYHLITKLKKLRHTITCAKRNPINLETEPENEDPENKKKARQAQQESSIQEFKDFENNLKEELTRYKPNAPQQNAKEAEKAFEAMVVEIARIEKCSVSDAIVGTAELLQRGAYLKSVSNRAIKINETIFTKKTMLLAMDRLKTSLTLRALAKSKANLIVEVTSYRMTTGNLYTQYKREHPEKNNEDLLYHGFYCTDFQIDNPSTPTDVKIFLGKRESDRSSKKK